MTVTSTGYGGAGQSINTVAWAQGQATHAGASPHLIAGSDAAVVSAVNRTVKVSEGVIAYGWGVVDTVTADETLTFDSATSTGNPRWDALVFHKDWQVDNGDGTRGKTSLQKVKGSGNFAAPTIPATLANTPGTAADHAVWLVPVTNTGVGTPVRVTPWATGNPLYFDSNTLALDPSWMPYPSLAIQYEPGSIQNKLLLRRGSGSGVFDDMLAPAWQAVTPANGAGSVNGNRALRMRVCAGYLEVAGSLVRTTGVAWTQSNGNYSVGVVPSGMRPNDDRLCAGMSDSSATIRCLFDSSTNYLKVQILGPDTNQVHLDNVRFPLL